MFMEHEVTQGNQKLISIRLELIKEMYGSQTNIMYQDKTC
jgi:hypothetical protein